MKTRVTFYSSVLILLICFSCTSQPRLVNHDFSIKVNYASKFSDDIATKISEYFIDFDLVNNTDSTLHFWIYTDAWDWNFILNSKELSFHKTEATWRPFVDIDTLQIGQKLNFKGIIQGPDNFNYNDSLRLGFVYIKPNERFLLKEITPFPPEDSADYMPRRYKSIIWSDIIHFKK